MPTSPKLSSFLGREYHSSSLQQPSLKIPTTFLPELRERLKLSKTSTKFILLCLLWYFSSALSNNSAKQILIQFDYPVTLTFIQFGFISGWCGLLALLQQVRGNNHHALFGAKHGIEYPTREIIGTTLPLSMFQIAGHIFGSLATSQIPVSVVHTVKVCATSKLSLITGIIAIIHSVDISIYVSCTLFSFNIFVIITIDTRRNARLFLRIVSQYSRINIRIRFNNRIRKPKHIHQKTPFPRIFSNRKSRVKWICLRKGNV